MGNQTILFGANAAYFASLLDSFLAASERRSYRIMPIADYELIGSAVEKNKIYSRELLYRAHFGASTGLLRLREWFVGARQALADRNVLVLAAAMRGLMEASADTWEALADVAPTLADSHTVIRQAVAGQLADCVLLIPELENDLIHFAFGRKLQPGELAPRLHEAKSARECVSVLEDSIPDVLDVYGALCQYSHPASPTIFRFAAVEEDQNAIAFDPSAGERQIRELVDMSNRIGQAVMALGIAPCVMTLKVLNAFHLKEVSTVWADGVSFEFAETWRRLATRLSDPSPPRVPSEEERARAIEETKRYYEPAAQKKTALAKTRERPRRDVI